MRKKREGVTLRLVCAVLVLTALCGALTLAGRTTVKNDYYEEQLRAAELLEDCFDAVRGYKEALGIPLSAHDFHGTGMIGAEFTGITTTIGALEAKRTTAWPDMAALCVRMLHEAGVEAGDTVGAGFSGSFPGMNLAVVAACETMGVKLVPISSVGASTYGANNPELTFPEMLQLLNRDGLLHTQSVAVTMGGDYDIGVSMDPELAEQVRQRLLDAGMNLMEIEDFARNLEAREAVYEANGPIDCFVAVGGNWTSLGRGEAGVSLGQGVLLDRRTVLVDENSGLVQRYMAKGLPVINLLNIKQIMAEYGMPFDPIQWPQPGESAAYSTTYYEKRWLALGLGGSAALLALCPYLRKKRPGKPQREEGTYE